MVADLCERGVLLRRGKMVFDGPSHEAVALMRVGDE
jgi:ABC-2 type transport system ATP-binding protein